MPEKGADGPPHGAGHESGPRAAKRRGVPPQYGIAFQRPPAVINAENLAKAEHGAKLANAEAQLRAVVTRFHNLKPLAERLSYLPAIDILAHPEFAAALLEKERRLQRLNEERAKALLSAGLLPRLPFRLVRRWHLRQTLTKPLLP